MNLDAAACRRFDDRSWLLIGPGYGLNMGNPRTWPLIAAVMLAQMIAARLLF